MCCCSAKGSPTICGGLPRGHAEVRLALEAEPHPTAARPPSPEEGRDETEHEARLSLPEGRVHSEGEASRTLREDARAARRACGEARTGGVLDKRRCTFEPSIIEERRR